MISRWVDFAAIATLFNSEFPTREATTALEGLRIRSLGQPTGKLAPSQSTWRRETSKLVAKDFRRNLEFFMNVTTGDGVALTKHM